MPPWFETWPPGGSSGLDPRIRAALELQGPAPDYRSQPLAEVRTSFAQQSARIPKLAEPVGRIENLVLASGLPIRVYTPAPGERGPILLYLHGGGWVVGSLDSHDDVCRSLCRRAGAMVVSAEYRLSPEARFPDALDDAREALAWAAAHGEERGGDPRRLAVGGDSAGANLAAGLALAVRDGGGPRIGFQLLIYPVTDRNFDTPSYREFAAGYGLTRTNMQWFWDCYLRDASDAADGRAAPLAAGSLKSLPRAYVATAQCDVLRDEGEAFAARLEASGVPVRCVRFQGLNHGFIRMAGLFPRAQAALGQMSEALRAAFD